METDISTELNVVCQKIQILYRKYDRHEILQLEYDIQLKELYEKKKILQSQYNIEVEKNIKERMEKMPEIEIKKEKKVKAETTSKKITRVSIILDTLQMKSIKTMDQAVDRILEKLPGDDKKKVVSQISLTIGMVKKGKGKLANYTWDEESFTLTPKQ